MIQQGSQEHLWNAFRRGDEHAYETMFRQQYRFLYNYGVNIERDGEEIKDCIQQLFLELWRSRAKLGPCTSVRSYLTASLRRIILRRIRTKRFHADINQIDPSFVIQPSPELEPIEAHEERARIELITEVLQLLPDRQKEAIYLRYYGERSFDEIAQIMGVTTRAVYKLIYRALDSLSAELAAKNIKLHQLFSFVWAL